MIRPSIAVTVETNPKHKTVGSSRLLESLGTVYQSAWQAYFDLAPVSQEWVTSITMVFRLMNDGATPTELEIALLLESSGETGQWKVEKKFKLDQLSSKDQPSIAVAVKDLMRKHVREQAAAQGESFKQYAEALEKAVEKLAPLTGLR